MPTVLAEPATGCSPPSSPPPAVSRASKRLSGAHEQLRVLRAARSRERAAQVEVLVGAAVYADLRACFTGEVDDLLGAGPGHVDGGPVTVTELAETVIDAPAEFGLALGMAHDTAARLMADALQLRHRLPATWAQVLAGNVEVWRARRIAQATHGQPDDVVARLDAQLAAIAHRVGSVALDRMLAAAMMRLHPDEHERRQQEALDGRHATLRQDVSHHGVARMEIAADLKDLVEFDATVSAVAAALAETLAAEGRAESLDVRRSMAVGVLADPESAADLLRDRPRPATTQAESTAWSDGRPHPADAAWGAEPPDPDREATLPEPPEDDEEPRGPDEPTEDSAGLSGQPGESVTAHDLRTPVEHLVPGGAGHPRQPHSEPQPGSRPAARPTPDRAVDPTTSARRSGRQLVLYAHLSQDSIEHCDPVGRVEAPGHGSGRPVLETLVREWAASRDLQLVVKPVLDLADHHRTDAYETPDALREQIVVLTGHCAFPWCNRSARTCDLDHIVAYDHRDPAAGGATCPCNVAPLCRRHHNLKTHRGWTYTTIGPGTWLWRSPTGYRYLVDPDGTRDVTPPDHDPGDGCHHRDGVDSG